MEHLTNTYNNGIDELEERGYFASTKYYTALQKVENENIAVLKQELEDLTSQMSEAVNSGSIQEGSEAWYEFQQNINSVKESIQEATLSIAEFANSIREIEWDRFDYIQEQISNITDESDFLIDLLSSSDLFTNKGQLTDDGMATMGLHGQNYNTYMAQADKYANQIKQINKEIASDPNNTKLLDRRQELLEAQQDSILAAEDEKQAIVDLVSDGIDLELEALQDLINKYEDSLDSTKDLYDYQKKIKDQTSEIARLQKQLIAYSGDNSEETKATTQKIKVDLADAMEELEETQYERSISEQKKLLDELYNEYETILNERLDNVDALLSDMIDRINANASDICSTILSQADKVGYTITDNQNAIWSDAGYAGTIIAKYGDAFLVQVTSVNDVISKIAIKTGAMISESEAKAAETIANTAATTAVNKSASTSTNTSTNTNTNTTSNTKTLTEDIKKGIATAIWIYGDASGWGNDPVRRQRFTEKFGKANADAIQSYIDAHANNGDLYRNWISMGQGKLNQYYYSAFKTGGLADYTGMAWLDGTPSQPEMVLNSKDTSNFIALKDAMASIASGNSPLADLFGKNGGNNVLAQLAKVSGLQAIPNNSVGDVTYQINIPIDHVQDYDDFMNQMRNDDKFEKLIQSMTIDRLVSGSKLSKNRYQW